MPYGGLIRNLHYWATQALLLTTGLHLLRVALTGAYRPPRRFNFLLGLGLLVLTLLLGFSGYMLRWDEGVQWALVAGTNLLKSVPGVGEGLYALAVGGSRPGPATLLRFYAWHVFGLTLLLIILSGWHLFRVRRDGGIAAPPPAAHSPNERITRAELVQREALAALFSGALLLLLAAFFPAPIAPPITPAGDLTAQARAPWFFLWIQHLLRLGDPFLMGVLIPALLLALLALIPYLPPPLPAGELGRWLPRRGRAAQNLVGLILLLLLVLTALELLSRAAP